MLRADMELWPADTPDDGEQGCQPRALGDREAKRIVPIRRDVDGRIVGKGKDVRAHRVAEGKQRRIGDVVAWTFAEIGERLMGQGPAVAFEVKPHRQRRRKGQCRANHTQRSSDAFARAGRQKSQPSVENASVAKSHALPVSARLDRIDMPLDEGHGRWPQPPDRADEVRVSKPDLIDPTYAERATLACDEDRSITRACAFDGIEQAMPAQNIKVCRRELFRSEIAWALETSDRRRGRAIPRGRAEARRVSR